MDKILRKKIKDAENILKRTSRKTGKYLTDNEIRVELQASHDNNETPTYRLHMMFFMIAVKRSNSPGFYRYPMKYEMITEAYIRMIRYWKSFDLTRIGRTGSLASPFSYYTQIANYRFIELINKTNVRKDKQNALRTNKDGDYISLTENERHIEQVNNEKYDVVNYFESLGDW